MLGQLSERFLTNLARIYRSWTDVRKKWSGNVHRASLISVHHTLSSPGILRPRSTAVGNRPRLGCTSAGRNHHRRFGAEIGRSYSSGNGRLWFPARTHGNRTNQYTDDKRNSGARMVCEWHLPSFECRSSRSKPLSNRHCCWASTRQVPAGMILDHCRMGKSAPGVKGSRVK